MPTTLRSNSGMCFRWANSSVLLAGRVLIALVLSLSGAARAAVIYSDTNDCEVQFTTSTPPFAITDLTSGGLISGTAGSTGKERCPVIPFQLPDLGAVANPFVTASFTFNYGSKQSTVLGNVDVYGLNRRAESLVLTNDYWTATSNLDPAATFIQGNIITANSTAYGLKTTDANGNAALVAYLNAQYDGGAGIGQYVFLRLSTDAPQTGGANRYNLTSAEGAASDSTLWPQINYTDASSPPDPYARPFIWVRDSERQGILAKIATNAWATSISNALVARVASDVASHQSNRDSFLRQLPVDWTLSPAKFKTIPTYSESTVRGPTEGKFNDGLDCAVLYYLTRDSKYARCAADILHNAVKTLLPVPPSTSVGDGGWIFQDDFLKEARVTGSQLPMIYDFLFQYLQTNQVYDVQTAGMVNFNFNDAQAVFRTLYQLARDHGQKDSNWSALMSTCMLNSILALDNASERATALQVYLVTGSSRQASLAYDYRNYQAPGDIWPESLQYSSGVGQIRASHMVLLERYDPSLTLFNTYSNLPSSLSRISYLRYPNGEQISFGDGHRYTDGQPFFDYELVYSHARSRGLTNLTALYGSLINGGVAAGDYNRSTLQNYSTLGQHNEPLQLLWFVPSIPELGTPLVLPQTDTLPYAGIALQRNPSTAGANYGLMTFVGGAAHVHSHACGMNTELYGLGQVMGAKSGRTAYGDTINENYYRVFASDNTIIVNGASRGEGGWGGFGINTVQVVAMEPKRFESGVSANNSLTCSSFVDDKGTKAEGTQQRTMAIIRTSPTNGYYVDFFRSKSTVTSQVATTLAGNVTNQFHDYLYHNFGDTLDITTNGVALPLVSQPNRFQSDIGDVNQQPGWEYFTNTVVSYPVSQSARAQFKATVSGKALYMDVHFPGVASREYAKVNAPAIVEAPSPYDGKLAPVLAVRQIGDAWNKPFAVVYEPHYGTTTSGSVTNVTPLWRGSVLVGLKVESRVAGRNLVQYVLSNPGAAETYTDSLINLSFTGRFAVVTDNGDNTGELYLGDGSSLNYRGMTVSSNGGTNTQASVKFAFGSAPVVTANSPVTVTVPGAPAFSGITRLPDGSISLDATGSVGVPFRLWTSTNLALSPVVGKWSLFTNATISNSSFAIQDSGATNYPVLFYRFSIP